ncbi:sensor histidine kinase [Rhizobium sp. G187]|uniref:sensor histidine kinase n=1 Tax=Rhizobium sp. G187 TaxID=3451352 RepID=UPI003EE79DB9
MQRPAGPVMGRLGLSARIAAIGICALLVLWLTILSALYRNRAETETAPDPARLAALATLLDGAPDAARETVLAAAGSPTLSLSLVDAATLAPLATEDDLSLRPEFAAYHAALGDRLLSIRTDASALRRKALARRVGTVAVPLEFQIRIDAATVLVALSRPPYAANLFGMPVGLGAGFLGTLIALLILILVQIEIRPLTRLAQAADRMDLSGPPIPLPSVKGRTPDVRALIEAFGRMQARLQVLMASRLTLISGVQHDVRSFATRLRLRVEAIPGERDRERAIKDIEDMIRLLDDALLSARAGHGSLDRELLDLGDWLKTDVADLQRAGLAVTLADPGAAEVPVLADRLALARILANLVENAVKYGDRAEVRLMRRGETAVIAVRDHGPGIAPDQRLMLLEPFTRGEPSRARQTGGAGLGLSIVKALVEAHDGEVEIAAADGGGAEILVTLPVFQP